MASRAKGLHKQDLFLSGLLTHATVAQAAKAAGISEATSTRWLKDPTFAARYAEARQRALTEALAFLQQSLLAAVAVLRTVMLDTNTRPSARVMAAGKLLEIGFKAIEFERIDQRMTTLLQGMEALQRAHTLTSP